MISNGAGRYSGAVFNFRYNNSLKNLSMISIDSRAFKGTFFIFAAGLGAALLGWFVVAIFFGILALLHLLFFRDPSPISVSAKAILSPASGTVVEIKEDREDRYFKGPALKVAIFLSLFDAHVNRSPCEGVIEFIQYEPGKHINALDGRSAQINESNGIGMEHEGKKLFIRQISGAIAHRIHCDVEKKQKVSQGQKLGIICYGSRAEIYFPKDAVQIDVKLGQRLTVGRTILGQWIL